MHERPGCLHRAVAGDRPCDVVEEPDHLAHVVAAAALHTQHTAGHERGEALREDDAMVRPWQPVQDRTAHHDVERRAPWRSGEMLRRRFDERLVRSRARPCFGEQRRLRVEADDVAVGDERRHLCSEVARAATDVEDAVRGAQRQRGEEAGVVAAVVRGVGGVGGAVPGGEPGDRRVAGLRAGVHIMG